MIKLKYMLYCFSNFSTFIFNSFLIIVDFSCQFNAIYLMFFIYFKIDFIAYV